MDAIIAQAAPPAEPTPLQLGFIGHADRMALADVQAAAERYKVGVAALQAVLDVESSGSGFDEAHRPKILFEPHIFFRELARTPALQAAAVKAGLAYPHQGMQPYPGSSEGNYSRLKRACMIEPNAAMHSASWGVAQVMGFNYATCGFDNVADMVLDCMDSEAAQFDLLLAYCEKNGLISALQRLDFRAFALGYNGPGAVEAYAGRLGTAYGRHVVPVKFPRLQIVAPMSVTALPPAAAIPVSLTPLQQAPNSANSLNEQEWLKIRAGAA